MKKVLLIGLLTVMALSMNAQNLLKNGKFENEVTINEKPTTDNWFILNKEPGNVTSITWETTNDVNYPKAIKMDNTNAEKKVTWYRASLGQRITAGMEKGIYMLTFYVKAKEAGTPIGVYIKRTNDEKNDEGKAVAAFVTRKDYDMEKQPTASGGQHNFTIKSADTWTKVVLYYDTNKSVNSLTSAKSYPDLTISETAEGDEILKDCTISFVCVNPGAVVEISNVALEKKQ